MPTTSYDNWKAITHAKAWCGKEDNPCGKFLAGDNQSDCAHFIAHCLKAGGIVISDTSGAALCPAGLAVRNSDLVPALRDLATKYTNVSEIGLTDAIIGDVGFLDSPLRPYHAFMVCEPVNLAQVPPPPVKVYAHSTTRCCASMDAKWAQWFSTLFRITDG
jgi:hypothetical protein